MFNKSKNILVFKSDRVGDLIYFSPCLKILKDNFPESHITLVCSSYNYQIAKNYSFINRFIILDKKNLIRCVFLNFKLFFLTKYKYLFQFDGKSYSYLISFFTRASIKSTICFIKHKKILFFKYKLSRPSKFALNFFFDNYVFCDEKYSISNNLKRTIHYQTLYFDLLKNLNLKIESKKNIFSLDKKYKKLFQDFCLVHAKSPYMLFHFDERWETFIQKDYDNVLGLLKKTSIKNNVIITTGMKNFSFLKQLQIKFRTFEFQNNLFINLNKEKEKEKNNVIILKKMPLNLLAYFIKNSEKNYSAHSGPVVHISAAFNKEFVDIIKKDKNYELDRWIPSVSRYSRINFENLNRN